MISPELEEEEEEEAVGEENEEEEDEEGWEEERRLRREGDLREREAISGVPADARTVASGKYPDAIHSECGLTPETI